MHRLPGPQALCAALLASACVLGGCQAESRRVGPDAPGSPPTGPGDPRAQFYDTNRFEQAQGGRIFRASGCDGCHAEGAPGFLHLGDNAWRRGGSTVDIYEVIAVGAPGMPAYERRLTPQQIWQLAGFVGGLHDVKPNQRIRSANAQAGEPSGATWVGPLE